MVITKGDTTDDVMYFIREGEADVLLSRDEPAVVTLGPGKFFGEEALLTAAPRSAYIRAKSDLKLFVLDKTSLHAVFREFPGLEMIIRNPLDSRKAAHIQELEAAAAATQRSRDQAVLRQTELAAHAARLEQARLLEDQLAAKNRAGREATSQKPPPPADAGMDEAVQEKLEQQQVLERAGRAEAERNEKQRMLEVKLAKAEEERQRACGEELAKAEQERVEKLRQREEEAAEREAAWQRKEQELAEQERLERERSEQKKALLRQKMAALRAEASTPSPGSPAPEEPLALAAEQGEAIAGTPWVRFYDDEAGAPYYYNADSGETTWEDPAEAAVRGQSEANTHPMFGDGRAATEADSQPGRPAGAPAALLEPVPILQPPASKQVDFAGQELALADFRVGGMLGRGSFGEVWHVQHGASKRYYALKMMRKDQMLEPADKRHASDERRVLECVQHDGVVSLHGTFQDSAKVYLVLEYVPGGELLAFMKDCKGTIPLATARFMHAELANTGPAPPGAVKRP
jgi:CRP-like cAMP-binding protein